jgi:trans-2,3-dihydro-3-hydroxyanthranilate isomerase
MRYQFYTADVFTNRQFGGNPLAVLTDARGLSSETMQQIAREFNLSETVFVLPPDNPAHTRRLRIFTPGAELPFAGHPTVGTAIILAQIDALDLRANPTRIVFEEGVGPVPVTIQLEAGRPTAAQLTAARLPSAGAPPPPAADLAAMLGLEVSDIRQDAYAPEAVSSGGTPFTIIPLTSRNALARAKLRLDLWERLLANSWAPAVYPICFDPELPGSDLRVRMFGPAIGIAEDPATGAAATALGGYLAARAAQRDGTLAWVVEQGFEMGRPSILNVEADKASGELTAVRVGGQAVLVSEGWITA